MSHKLNAERSVVVATDYFWNKDMTVCPRNAKVQLLGKGGVANYGRYDGKETFWTHWAPLPKIRKKEKYERQASDNAGAAGQDEQHSSP